MNDEELLIIKPNEDVVLELSELYQNHFINIMSDETDQPEVLCRVLIQDQSDYGIILPANLVDNKEITFNLPEQLCIFNPNKNYILKVEVVLETELITPIFKSCKIDLNDLLAAEKETNEEEDEKPFEASVDSLNEPEEQDLELDTVLDAIAPVPKVVVKKTKIEDLVTQLDEEFVKNALWRKQEEQKKETAPVLFTEPEPSTLKPETLAVKQKMKNLLRNMLA